MIAGRGTADAAGHASSGCPVEVVDLSAQGLQVQSVRPLRPDSHVLARVVVGEQAVTIRAIVLRCSVWAVEPEAVTYPAGLRFEELCPPISKEFPTAIECRPSLNRSSAS